ncbi:hypothetical protein BFJ70_g17293 [Fusarium oxysporum]|nr:hypothetical protein BFJ70_g17293 [Fusarium oxysporum]
MLGCFGSRGGLIRVDAGLPLSRRASRVVTASQAERGAIPLAIIIVVAIAAERNIKAETYLVDDIAKGGFPDGRNLGGSLHPTL